MKIFDIARKDDLEPLEFGIRVTRMETKPDTDEAVPVEEVVELRTLPVIPSGLLRESRDNVSLIASCLDQESERCFVALTKDKDALIEGSDLNEITKWLMSELVGRPTKRPTPSGSGSRTTGDTSEGSSPAPA